MGGLIKKIIIYTIAISLILSGIAYIVTWQFNVAIGIMIGAIARLAGLNSIIKMSDKIELYQNPKAKGTKNYMGRFLFYGLVIGISIWRGVSIVALLIGFMIMNVVIIFVSKE